MMAVSIMAVKSSLQKKTVQSVLEQKLSFYLKEKVNLIFAGRTDKGVHANGQVANFFIDKLIVPIEKLSRVINNSMSKEKIYIRNALLVEDTFNSRFDAKVRLYRYQIKNFHQDNYFDICDKDFYYHYRFPIDLKKLSLYFNELIGYHDFTTFCSKKDESKNKKREIFKIDCYQQKDITKIYLYGNAFLRNMVRSLVGNVLHLYKKEESPKKIQQLLQAQNPDLAKYRVPAHALFLEKIFYCEIFGKMKFDKA